MWLASSVLVAEAVEYAAERGYKVGRSHIINCIRQGRIKAVKGAHGNSPWFIDVHSLDAFIEENLQRKRKADANGNRGERNPTEEQKLRRVEYMRSHNNRPDVKQRRRNYQARNKRKALHQQRVRRKRKNSEYTDSILHLLAVLDEITGDGTG